MSIASVELHVQRCGLHFDIRAWPYRQCTEGALPGLKKALPTIQVLQTFLGELLHRNASAVPLKGASAEISYGLDFPWISVVF